MHHTATGQEFGVCGKGSWQLHLHCQLRQQDHYWVQLGLAVELCIKSLKCINSFWPP